MPIGRNTTAAAETVSNAEYTQLLAKLQDIPTLPNVAMKVAELINNPNSSSGEIAQVLKRDQVLTAKILRLVNSSYYAIPGGVTDVQRALAFLGFNTVAQLVLSLSVFSVFPGESRAGDNFSMQEFWKHALGVAVCSEMLARKLGHSVGVAPEEAFTCGLLHDIGKLVMHEIDVQRLRSIVDATAARGCSFVEAEREWETPGHSFLGEMMATRWGLPQKIRLCIRYHHFDVSGMDTILAGTKPLIHIVRLANALCVNFDIGRSGDCSDGGLTPDMLGNLKLRFEDIPELRKQLDKDMEKAGAFLNASR